MRVIRERLIERFSTALRLRSAAVFLGAGLSQGAGYPTWRGLLEDPAREIGLDVRLDCDLVDVAQFVLNDEGGNRTRLNQLIKDQFGPSQSIPETLKVLARLPLSSIWTTNYDRLVERAYEDQGIPAPDVKWTSASLALRHTARTVLYKMHGSVEDPNSCVLTKDDFETYAREHAGFLHLLEADYLEKTFLFLGLSFADPNIKYVLSTIRSVFRGSTSHFAVMQRPQESAYASKTARYQHDLNLFNHWCTDMTRYGIRVYEFDDFEEVERLLNDMDVEYTRQSSRHTVYVNGSYEPDKKRRVKVERLCRRIGELLADREKRLATGLGPVVGASTLRGFIERLDDHRESMHGRLLVRSVRKGHENEHERRETLMRQCDTWILVGGSGGTKQDVAVARDLQAQSVDLSAPRRLIPIHGTGGTADAEAEAILAGPRDAPEYELVNDLKRAKFNIEDDDEHDIDRVIEVLKRHIHAS
jgi:hypothetical protein